MAAKKPKRPKLKKFPSQPKSRETSTGGRTQPTIQQFERWEKRCSDIAKHNCNKVTDYKSDLKVWEGLKGKKESIKKKVDKLRQSCKI